jgi:chromosomal replication initiator protein
MSNNNSIQNIKDISSNNLDWGIVQNDMKSKFGSDIYESWIRKIEFIEEMHNYILLSVSSRFIRDWITSRYLDQILQVVKVYKKNLTRIEFKIIEKNSNNFNDDENEVKAKE